MAFTRSRIPLRSPRITSFCLDSIPVLVRKLIALEKEPMSWGEDVKRIKTPILLVAGDVAHCGDHACRRADRIHRAVSEGGNAEGVLSVGAPSNFSERAARRAVGRSSSAR